MAQDDFSLWLHSPQGQLSEHALLQVLDSLEHCSVDPQHRVIVWDDGERLSISQSALRIHLRSSLPLPQLESHIIGWLEMHYVQQGLNQQQIDNFERLIDAWIHDYYCQRPDLESV